MHYAGPREAIHHISKEKWLDLIDLLLEEIMRGLDNYHPLDAYKTVIKKRKF